MFVKNKNIHSYTSLKALLLSLSCFALVLLFSFKSYANKTLQDSSTLFQLNKTYTLQASIPNNTIFVNGYVKDEKVEELDEQQENENFHALNITKLHRNTVYFSAIFHKTTYYNLKNSYKNQVGNPLFLLHHSWQGYLS